MTASLEPVAIVASSQQAADAVRAALPPGMGCRVVVGEAASALAGLEDVRAVGLVVDAITAPYVLSAAVQRAQQAGVHVALWVAGPIPDALAPAYALFLDSLGVNVVADAAGLAGMLASAVASGPYVAPPRPLLLPEMPDFPGEMTGVLKHRVAGVRGALPPPLCQTLLNLYAVGTVPSTFVGQDGGLPAALPYPATVRPVSMTLPRPWEIGAVIRDLVTKEEVVAAITKVRDRVRAVQPDAVIDGYEIQAQVPPGIPARLSFTPAPPFGALVRLGHGDGVVTALGKQTVDQAIGLVDRAGLLPVLRETETPVDVFAQTVAHFSRFADGFFDTLTLCETALVIETGTGQAKVVEAVMVSGGQVAVGFGGDGPG